ncbi:undifferentiated embryonic cell transcription factor 1-like [Limosa lapponica baueri]|uniref:Undifferentiated embryonic cell transcription factor 1-like n=1 Tax=Limosa lapponica baueri TaxID=1758121 RepID=A0A2I0TXP3_LIMLA|nr:undifferentiated embryonic cell transcription factor 1-like [Limosa lapponica baueri]
MPRGRAWTQAEVSSLLALVEGSGEAALLMASTSRPNEALWREISQGLAAAGYGRSVAQCRSKWKALKQAFHSERETRRRAGCHSPRLPPHYRAMKSIWKAAGRPVFGERRMPDLVRKPPRKRRSALAVRSPSSSKPRGHNAGKDAPGVLLSPLLQCAKDEPDSRSGVAGLLQNVQQLLVQILQTSRQQQALLESLASDTVSHLHFLSHSLVQEKRDSMERTVHAISSPARKVGKHSVVK